MTYLAYIALAFGWALWEAFKPPKDHGPRLISVTYRYVGELKPLPYDFDDD